MQGRRNSKRIGFASPSSGVLRVLSDVVVQCNGENELVAFSRQPAVPGETLLLDIVEGGRPQPLMVCVIESLPVVLDGDMRHRIRMQSDEPLPILSEQVGHD